MQPNENPVRGPTGQGSESRQESNLVGGFTTSRPGVQEPCNLENAFRQAMAGAGLDTPDKIIPDGRLHRCRIDGDRAGKRDGWYVLHLDPPASGAFGHWRTGTKGTWCAKSRDRITPGEWAVIQRRIEANRTARQQEEHKRHRRAQTLAVAMWARAYPATNDLPYLTRKRVRSYGLRVAPVWDKRIQDESGQWQTLLIEDVLLVPMRDWDGYLWNLQAIFPSKVEALGRDKDFLLGGRKQGLFFLIGTVNETKTLVLVEGYATGCSVHVATGYPVLVCFDCGNLEGVAVEARRRFPLIDLVIGADNDVATPGNPGLHHARKAALAARARLAFPTFDQQEVAA